MIKGLGRILLVAVGAFMLATGIMFLTVNHSFSDFHIENLSSILLQIVTILAGLSAAFAGLSGRGGFWFTIFSLVMLGLIIYYAVVNASKFSDGWTYIGQFVLGLIVQIIYVLGFVFIRIGSKD